MAKQFSKIFAYFEKESIDLSHCMYVLGFDVRNLIIDQVISNVKPVTPLRNISHKSNTGTSPIDPLFHMNAFQLSFWGQNKRENCLHSSTCRIMTLVAQQLSKSVINHLQQPSGSWYLWMQLFLWTWNLRPFRYWLILQKWSIAKFGTCQSFF